MELEEEAPYPDIPAELTTIDQAENIPIPIKTVAEVEEGLHAHMEAARAAQNADLAKIGNVYPLHIIENDDEDSNGQDDEEGGVEIVEEEEPREDPINLTDENMEDGEGETSQAEAEHDANGWPISRNRGRLPEQY